MKLELEQELVSKYPDIFKDYKGDPKDTCLAFGARLIISTECTKTSSSTAVRQYK
jgi:hypothetical protein